MRTRIAFGADHGGLALKNELLGQVASTCEVTDMGAHVLDPADDYPDFVETVAQEVVNGRADRGILVCGSVAGACIAANKVPGVRACVCHDTYSAHQAVEHDNMNVLCLGARIVGIELAKELVNVFLNATFSDEERHRRRLEKVDVIERRALERK